MAASSSRSLWWFKRAAKDDSGAIAADDVAHWLVLTGAVPRRGRTVRRRDHHAHRRPDHDRVYRAHKFAAVVKGCCGSTHNSGSIVSCGNRPVRPCPPQATEREHLTTPTIERLSQVTDFIDLTGLARRTGRFPQLVDPRSSVNGAVIDRFAKVSRRSSRRWSEVLRPEFAPAVDCASRNHELAFTTVVDRLRSFRRRGHVRFDDLPDEQAVGPNHARVTQTAFEIRVALRDQGRRHLGRPLRGQAKPLEFVDVCRRGNCRCRRPCQRGRGSED